MKRQDTNSKFGTEQRVSNPTSSLLKKLFEGAKATPRIINAESIHNTRRSITNEARVDLEVATRQFFGVEMRKNEEVSLPKKEEGNEKIEKKAISSEYLDYFAEFKRAAEGKNGSQEQAQIHHQLEMILSELQKIKESSDELENVFQDVVVDEVPQKPGAYHLTFFEGFLKLVVKMRERIEDGVIFAKLFKSRKKEKSYHAMAQKKGTSFTLHQDRAVATQTG